MTLKQHLHDICDVFGGIVIGIAFVEAKSSLLAIYRESRLGIRPTSLVASIVRDYAT